MISTHSVSQPHLRKDLEDIQERATRMLSELKDLTYSGRLRIPKLIPSREHRCRAVDKMDALKYTRGISRTNKPVFMPAPSVDQGTRGNGFVSVKNVARARPRIYLSFLERVVSDWNSLPDSVVKGGKCQHL